MPGAEVPSSAGFGGRTVAVAALAAAGAGAYTAGVPIPAAFLIVLAVRRTGRLRGRCGTAYVDATGRGGDG
jgi:hypothetical protein